MLFISRQRHFLPSKYLSFFLAYFVMQQNGLIRKIMLLSNFMTSQHCQQAIVIHLLPNISRINWHQTTEFGQLIECNIRNIFLDKSCTKCGGETSCRPFSETLKLSISLDQQPNVLHSWFSLYAKLRAIEILL